MERQTGMWVSDETDGCEVKALVWRELQWNDVKAVYCPAAEIINSLEVIWDRLYGVQRDQCEYNTSFASKKKFEHKTSK